MKGSPLPPDLAEALADRRTAGEACRLGTRVLYFRSTSSTNDVAAAIATDAGSEGTVVIAESQTAGRGRRGRAWFSPPGAGLYVSIILAPSRAGTAPDRATALLTLAAGVALAEAIEHATGLRPDLKWPNDVYAGGRKLAGILAETAAPVGLAWPPSSVILGYGINVGAMSYPRELRDSATSLETEIGRPVERAPVLAASLDRLEARYLDLLTGRFDAILDTWRLRAPSHRGARVRLPDPAGYRTGVTDGIDDWGALTVRTAGGLERVVAGWVEWE